MCGVFSATMGIAADSWKALMDRLLTLRDDCPKMKEVKQRVKENILKLIDIYYVALDAPKKGGKKVSLYNFLFFSFFLLVKL